MVTSMKMTVLWYVMQCSLIEIDILEVLTDSLSRPIMILRRLSVVVKTG